MWRHLLPSRATLGRGKKKKRGKEVCTLHSELFQNILTTEKAFKHLKKRTAFDVQSSLFTEGQRTQFNYYMLDNGSLILNRNEFAKDERRPAGSNRNSHSLFFKWRRLWQHASHYSIVTRNSQDKKGLKFHTRNIPSFTSLQFATAVGTHLSMYYCSCTTVRSFREVSSNAEPGSCTPRQADSILRSGGVAFSTYLVECVSIQNNQIFWPQTFLAPV